MTESVQVTETIAAEPLFLYGMVSDVTRMGERSPETTSCRWLDGATGPVVGARFTGTNRRGPLRYRTTCRVTDAEPGRRFAFTVTFGQLAIADWAYDFRPLPDGGCEVTESWTERRHVALRLTSPAVMGIIDRAKHNRTGMQATLAALKNAAEAMVEPQR